MNSIDNFLKNNINKNLVINQKGFITSKISINKMIYNIKSDILTVSDKTNTNNISINTNQVFNLKVINNMIILQMDNDTVIEIKKDIASM